MEFSLHIFLWNIKFLYIAMVHGLYLRLFGSDGFFVKFFITLGKMY
jgi:hypothetical protein